MIVQIDYEKCFNDGKCIRHCPVHAIRFENNRVIINEDKCTGCGKCIKVCPINAISFRRKK